MNCTACGDKPENTAKDFTKAVIEIDNPAEITLFRKVVIPTSLGDEHDIPPTVGKYKNVLLYYEKSGSAYLYSSDGIPTCLTLPATVGTGVLTIKFDGDTVATFSANSTENVVADIQVENVNGVAM